MTVNKTAIKALWGFFLNTRDVYYHVTIQHYNWKTTSKNYTMYIELGLRGTFNKFGPTLSLSNTYNTYIRRMYNVQL